MADGAKNFIKASEKFPKEVSRELRREIRASADLVAMEARAIVTPHSKSIPPTIKSGARISVKNVTGFVTAGGQGTKKSNDGNVLAGLYEYGNRGKGGGYKFKEAHFRHPVFAKGSRQEWRWTTQKRYPFLGIAVEANKKKVERGIQDAVARALKRAGLT